MTGPPKILVADDSPLVRRLLERTLTTSGFEVVTAADGLEAIEKAFTEPVSLVILDVTMPRMNGYQTCRLLKTDPGTAALPVVILTSGGQPDEHPWGLGTAPDHYLTKDAEPEKVVTLVRSILARPGARAGAPPDRRPPVDILARVNDLLDRRVHEATVLAEISRAVRLGEFEPTFTAVMRLVARVVDFTVGGLAFADGDALDLVLLVNRPASSVVVEETRARMVDAAEAARGAAPYTSVQVRRVSPADLVGLEETALGAFTGFPVLGGRGPSGLLGLAGRKVEKLPRETEVFLSQVAAQAHLTLENCRLFERVKNLSIRDGVTGLFNHRHIIDVAAHEMERGGRYEQAFAVLMIDVDHFKRVNDQFGHPVGDAVLKEMGEILVEKLRTVDAVGRYGGEEFMVVLPHTPREEAYRTAERLRAAIAGHAFPVGPSELHVTVSIGVACFPTSGVDSSGSLIREADQALYRAKQAGRNRVM